MCIYRVFIKYCVFFQEFSKVCHLSLASTRLLLVVQKNYQPIRVTVHSRCVESFKGFLQRCRRGRGCSELCKNTIFPEHPVYACTCLPNKESTRMFDLPGLCRRLNTRDFKWYFKSIKERDSFILTHHTFILSPKPLFF